MKLPNCKKVLINENKLLNYILSETHMVGKFKAKYFRNLGFNETNVKLLEKAFRKIAGTNEVVDFTFSPYGTKFIVDGEIRSPKNITVTIRTVWIIETDKNRPNFVTAYPK